MDDLDVSTVSIGSGSSLETSGGGLLFVVFVGTTSALTTLPKAVLTSVLKTEVPEVLGVTVALVLLVGL